MKCYVVDAFTDRIFKGNPAAVCILGEWISDTLMLEIARENNLSETAFAVRNGDVYELRWFTPGGEIDLCGHATLAAAYVLMRFAEPKQHIISFLTQSGLLTVKKQQDLYEMDMPAYALTSTPVTAQMEQAIGFRPLEAWIGRDLVCIMNDEEQVCGSGHCHVIPFWSGRLPKQELRAFQASRRSGILHCRMEDDRVVMAGNAALYSINELFLPETL